MIAVGCLLTVASDMEAYAIRENLEYAWRQWAAASCVERNGDHSWELEGDDPEDGSSVRLRCVHGCGAGVDEIAGAEEVIEGELDGIVIRHGRHLSLLPFTCPVEMTYYDSEWWTGNGYEYDFTALVTATGPVVSRWADR